MSSSPFRRPPVPSPQMHVPPARRVEEDVGSVLDPSGVRERAVLGAEPQRAQERRQEPFPPGGEAAPFRGPVEHLIGDREQVEVAVGDLEQRLEAYAESPPARSCRLEDRPERPLVVVGEALKQPP